MMSLAKTLCLVLLLVCVPVLAGNIYRWTDANGVVHYSDQPRPGVAAVAVEPGLGTAEPPPQPDSASRSRAERVAAIRAEQCDKARERLRMLQESGRVVSVNAEGEESALDSDERVEAILRAQQDVAGLCQ